MALACWRGVAAVLVAVVVWIGGGAPAVAEDGPPGGPVVCADVLANSGFEGDEGWVISDTQYLAGYSRAVAHGGVRSMRTGVPPGSADVFSYSSFSQAVQLPEDLASATLRYWMYAVSEEVVLAGEEEKAWGWPAAGEKADGFAAALDPDRQYVLILDSTGAILSWPPLLWRRGNERSWLEGEHDLAAYAGQAIRVHMGTFNNGVFGSTAMYVDDASLVVCRTWRQVWVPAVFSNQ